MGDNVYVSYSSAVRYKTCPRKYFLAKKYKNKIVYSSLPFGLAVEAGVESMFRGKTLEEGLAIFEDHWTNERVKNFETGEFTLRPVFDNLELQFYATDFDRNLITEVEEAQIETWKAELDAEASWFELFDEIAETIKKEGGVVPEAQKFYNRVVWLSSKVRGKVMLTAFHNKLLPKMKLVNDNACQVQFEIANAEGDKIPGAIDFVVKHEDYNEPIILDLKTAAWPYPEHALLTSEQLRTYVAAKGEEYQTSRAGYLVLIKKIKIDKSCNKCGAPREGMSKNCKSCGEGKYTKASFDGDVQFTTRIFKEEELDGTMAEYGSVATAIKNNIDYKNPDGCTKFGRRCEFYDVCWKKKNPSDLPHLEEKKSLTPVAEDATTETGE